jgi:hypothetical protein
MSEDSLDVMHDASEGGTAGTLPVTLPRPVLVGPSTADEHNRVSSTLIPVACWRVDDIRFEFGSSFVVPEVSNEIKHLATLREKHKLMVSPQPGAEPVAVYPPLSIFGHTDPVGTDDYNKLLSGRRAAAIYGLLTRDTGLWNDLCSQPLGGDNWGSNAIKTMRAALGIPDDAPGPGRSALFLAYMDKLCSPEFRLDKKEDFLAGGEGGGKGDYQGCGEFNPLLLFSQEEERDFASTTRHASRNRENAPNRRVMVLLFRPGSRVDPGRWPCPRAQEGTAGCLKRLWSDGEKRRSTHLPGERREFKKTKDTFACRFYDRLAGSSPCERFLKFFKIRLFDRLARPLPGAPFLVMKAGQPVTGKADTKGDITLQEVKVPSTVTVFWSRPERFRPPRSGEQAKPEDFEYTLDVNVEIEESSKAGVETAQDGQDAAKAAEAERRLHNLGFSMGATLEEKIRFFQRELEREETGLLEDIDAELKKRHDECDPPSRYRRGGRG